MPLIGHPREKFLWKEAEAAWASGRGRHGPHTIGQFHYEQSMSFCHSSASKDEGFNFPFRGDSPELVSRDLSASFALAPADLHSGDPIRPRTSGFGCRGQPL